LGVCVSIRPPWISGGRHGTRPVIDLSKIIGRYVPKLWFAGLGGVGAHLHSVFDMRMYVYCIGVYIYIYIYIHICTYTTCDRVCLSLSVSACVHLPR